MEERASGIILRTRALTETSLVVHLLTAEQGRIALVAKGARRPKSPFSGKLDLFYEADLSFVRSRRSDLHNLREVILRDAHPALRRDLTRLSAASYASILVEWSTETDTPIPEIFGFFQELLRTLDERAPGFAFALAVEARFLDLIGVAPRSDVLSGPARQFVAAAATLPLAGAAELPVDAALRQELELLFRRGIGTALERLPPQRDRFLRSLRLSEGASTPRPQST